MFKDGINEIQINSYDELVNIICGKHEKYKEDLRKKFIFRGLSDVKYELIPSGLRKNKYTKEFKINEFIDDDQEFKVLISKKEADENNLKYEQIYDNTRVIIYFDKYGNPLSNKDSSYKAPENKLHIEKENYILLKFLNYADKSGLKVKTEGLVRYLLHHNTCEPLDEYGTEFDILEITSLAQHYGLPTKAMDWSYDYKVSLYFAVKDILTEDVTDGLLWALNYKLVENPKYHDEDYHINLNIYRPEYNTNPNLNAQKGLFTFLERYCDNYCLPLNELISLELNQNLRDRPMDPVYGPITTIPTKITKNNTIFYKFIIPKEIKHEILKELYLDGYSEEYLFPGYNGVTKSIKNRLKLKEIYKQKNFYKK